MVLARPAQSTRTRYQLVTSDQLTVAVLAGTCVVVPDDLWLCRARVRSPGGSRLRY